MAGNNQTLKAPVALMKNLLLGFVLISMGFALGKGAASKQLTGALAQPAVAAGGRKISVVYAHTTYRCATCNTIEKLARDTVEDRFGKEQADGLVEWRTVNFQEDEAFARQYGIASSCVVVILEHDGANVDFQRLDDVWTRYQHPEAFKAYVAEAILKALNKTGGKVL